MLNKFSIIAGLVILAVIGGLVFLLSNKPATPSSEADDSSPAIKSSASESGGIKELTKETASQAIKNLFQADTIHTRKSSLCLTSNQFMSGGIGGWSKESVFELEKAGFVKTGSKDMWGNYAFILTEQMRPYLLESTTGNICKNIIIGEPDSVEVTDLTEAGIEKTEKTVYVKAVVKYKPTPVGAIVNKLEASRDEFVQRNFVFRSGSWELE